MYEAANQQTIETTLSELVSAVHEVTNSEDEAFAVLDRMLAEGRISVLSTAPARAA